MAEEMVQTAGEYEEVAAAEAAENFLSEELPENVFGAAKAGTGMWASCLRVMHPTEVSDQFYQFYILFYFLMFQGKTLEFIQFDQNEAAFRFVFRTVVHTR